MRSAPKEITVSKLLGAALRDHPREEVPQAVLDILGLTSCNGATWAEAAALLDETPTVYCLSTV